MSRKLVYQHVDVFTDKPFGGNQLAVFTSPGSLTKRQMQLIAREINFSETTFIFPSKDREIDAKVRIFTPAEEVPFAGHPAIGTAFVILSEKKGGKKKPERLALQLNIGKIDLDIKYVHRKINGITMHQPVPTFGSALQNRGQAARALGIKTYEILGGGVVSNGLDFLIVEAQSPEIVSNAHLNLEDVAGVLSRHKVIGIYLFARVESRKVNIHSRFFAPTLNFVEDPATGSASGALGGYLARILKFPQKLDLKIEQGIEMGRPSSISVAVTCDRGMLQSVSVYGQVVKVGEGLILLS